jgi:hypothetical protein
MLMEELFELVPGAAGEAMQKRLWRQVNYHYFEICKEVSWAELRCDPVTLDFGAAGVDSTGLWLPSDAFGIDLVWDNDDSVEFYRVDMPVSELDERKYRYYLHSPSRASLYEGADLVLQKGASSFTSAGLTAAGTDPDGEYVVFDDEPGFYLIDSSTTPFTFDPAYYGANKTQKPFAIRPWQSTKKMVIQEPDGDLLYDRDVLVYYWRAPTPLYREQDMIQLPSVEYLKLRVLRSIPEAKGNFPVNDVMLRESKRLATKENRKFPRAFAAKSQQGHNIDFSREIYAER